MNKMIQLDKFGYVVKNFTSTVNTPSPGVNYETNNNINIFGVTSEDLCEFNDQDFLDILGVYHDRKKCALISAHDVQIATIIYLKQKGLFLTPTKTWKNGYISYFVSKSKEHSQYMSNMFGYYVTIKDSSNIFHAKMGLGLGYSKPSILNFIKRINS